MSFGMLDGRGAGGQAGRKCGARFGTGSRFLWRVSLMNDAGGDESAAGGDGRLWRWRNCGSAIVAVGLWLMRGRRGDVVFLTWDRGITTTTTTTLDLQKTTDSKFDVIKIIRDPIAENYCFAPTPAFQ